MSEPTRDPRVLREELLALLERRLCGEATAADADRVEEILAAEPSLFAEYLRRVHLHVCLDARFRKPAAETEPVAPVGLPAEPAETSPAGRTVPIRRMLAVAAAALLAAGVWWFAAGRPADRTAPGGGGTEAAAAEAEVTRVVDAVWDGPGSGAGPAPTVGGRASRFRLRSGLAEIRWGSGVTAVLQGPADLEVTGPAGATLRRGRVVATVPEGARGFAVATPSAEVVDLGTEFGVAVEGPDVSDIPAPASGTAAGTVTTVQVYRGEVVAGARGADWSAPGDPRHLKAGQAVAIAAAEGPASAPAAPVEVAFREDRFVRRFPSPEVRRAETGQPATPYNVPALIELRIRPAPGPVTVDGDLSDWDLSGEFRGRCAEPYGDSYHVRGAMMYDAAGVYIAAVVGDPDPLRNAYAGESDDPWRGGVVQVRLSTDPSAGWPVDADNFNGGLRPRDRNPRLTHITMWRSATLGRPCLHLAHGMDYHGTAFDPPGFRGAVLPEPAGRGYRLEYFVPWELLGVRDGRPPPRAGDVTAVSWTVHWAFEDGRTWRGQWVDITNPDRRGQWTFQKAAAWGRAIWEPR